jgi:universal stress protein A
MKDVKALKKILFCTDFSASADQAFGYACAIARAGGSRIVVTHVVSGGFDDPEYTSFVTPELRTRIDEGIRGKVDQALKERYTAQCPADTPCEILILKGKAPEQILDVAGREKIDLIVVGGRGQTAIGHLFMGSVAQRVAQNSSVPVLLVPAAS